MRARYESCSAELHCCATGMKSLSAIQCIAFSEGSRKLRRSLPARSFGCVHAVRLDADFEGHITVYLVPRRGQHAALDYLHGGSLQPGTGGGEEWLEFDKHARILSEELPPTIIVEGIRLSELGQQKSIWTFVQRDPVQLVRRC